MPWRVWIEPKPSGKFLVRRRDSQGNNMPSKSCSTKSLANELEKKWRHELEYQDLGLINPRRPVLEMAQTFMDELENANRLDYLATFKTVFKVYLADKKTVTDLTRDSIVRYRSSLMARVKPVTVKSKLRHLSAWLGWCVKQGYIKETPFENISIPDYEPQPKYLTDAEIIALDNAATGKMKLAWRLANTTGLRQKNVRQARGEHIENGMLITQRTKGKRPISSPLDKSVLALLPKHVPPGPLFPEWFEQPEGRYALERAFRALRKKAGVRKGIYWHMARHTYVKRALQSGLTTFEVMRFTGHVSPQSMAPYANFEMDKLKDRHALIKFPVGRGRAKYGKL
jgi:integrase